MANESISWPAGPSVTDASDGTQCYNMGRAFTLTADSPVVGVEWRVPDSVATPNGPHAVAIWANGTRVAFRTVTPTPGGLQQFIFDPADYLDGIGYDGLTTDALLAAVYMNHYCYNTSEHIGATSPSGTIVAGDMLLIPFNGGASGAPIPDNGTGLNFYVSPIISLGEDPEDHPTTGTATVEMAASASSTTNRVTIGTAGVRPSASATYVTSRATSSTVPVAASATATVSTARAIAATAPVALTGSAAVATSRAVSGSAPMRPAATAVVSTSRAVAGTATVEMSGGAYAAAGAPGPWLTTAPRTRALTSRGGPDRIVTRTQVVS